MPDTQSKILSPLTAIRLVWTLTSEFSKPSLPQKDPVDSADPEKSATKSNPTPDPSKTQVIDYTKIIVENPVFKEMFAKAKEDRQEQKYFNESVIAMSAALRNLAIIYNGRELNFKENGQLRDQFLKSIERDIQFGSSITDYIRAIPTTAITVLLGYLGTPVLFGREINNSELLFIVILFGLIGIFFYWFFFIYLSTRRKVHCYVLQDHERNIYYQHYLRRAKKQLKELYHELQKIHQKNFDYFYYEENNAYGQLMEHYGDKKIDELFDNIYPTCCSDIDDCIHRFWYKPDSWADCETRGKPNIQVQQKTCQGKKKSSYETLSGVVLLLVIISICIVITPYFTPPVLTGIILTKSPDFLTIPENQTLNISVTLENHGSTGIRNITIYDRVPDSFRVQGDPTKIPDYLEPGEIILQMYNITSLKAGKFQIPPAKVRFKDNNQTKREILSNSPVYEVSNPFLQSGTEIDLFKSVHPAIAMKNQTVIILVTIRNTGIKTIYDITIQDTVPEVFQITNGSTSCRLSILRPEEEFAFQYCVNTSAMGTFILEPAIASFRDKKDSNHTSIESNFPEVKILTGFEELTNGSADTTRVTSELNNTEVLNILFGFLENLKRVNLTENLN